jgi:hypothetical protein
MERAAVKKRDIVARYYRNYLEQRER